MSTGSFAVIITKDDIGHGGRPLFFGPDVVAVKERRCRTLVLKLHRLRRMLI